MGLTKCVGEKETRGIQMKPIVSKQVLEQVSVDQWTTHGIT